MVPTDASSADVCAAPATVSQPAARGLWTAAAAGRRVLHAGAVPQPTHQPTHRPTLPSIADAARLRLLREEVGRLRQRETRRRFDATLHIGLLGGPRTGFVVAARDLPVMDVELRVDVVSGLLLDSPPDWRSAWLVRPGIPEPHDVDLQ